MRFSSGLFALVAVTLTSCVEEIRVVEPHDCGSTTHPSEDAAGSDGGVVDGPVDSGASDAGGPEDSETIQGCTAPCITSVSVSTSTLDVGDLTTLQATVANPDGVPLTFSLGEIRAERPANRPALVMSEIEIESRIDPATGMATFSVREVPPWFFTTAFHLTIEARAVDGSLLHSADAAVRVRGNILYTVAGVVYSMSSKGDPTKNVNPRYDRGQLIGEFVTSPRALALARDGTLLVYDRSGDGSRIVRFQLEGENLFLHDFVSEDETGAPLLRNNEGNYTLIELADGRVAALDYESVSPFSSRIIVWSADGSLDRTLSSKDRVRWSCLAQDEDGNFLVCARDSGADALVRVHAETGNVMETIIDRLTDPASAILRLDNGDIYVGARGAILYLPPTGGAQYVAPLPVATSQRAWHDLTEFSGGLVLAASDERTDHGNIAKVQGRSYLGALRDETSDSFHGIIWGVQQLE